jgi:hypothetical protein
MPVRIDRPALTRYAAHFRAAFPTSATALAALDREIVQAERQDDVTYIARLRAMRSWIPVAAVWGVAITDPATGVTAQVCATCYERGCGESLHWATESIYVGDEDAECACGANMAVGATHG